MRRTSNMSEDRDGLRLPERARMMVLAAVLIMINSACRGPVQQSPLIDRYRTATCLPPNGHPDFPGSERAWNHQIKTRKGAEFVVVGFQGPGARVLLRERSAGAQVEVASPGDYVYPVDVRYDAASEVLYVKAEGLAGGISRETWLFEFEIAERKSARVQVDPGVMPAECR